MKFNKENVMKNLFEKFSKRKGISDLQGISINQEDANKMSGGFKEYKPTIYTTHGFIHKKSKLSHLLTGSEEII